MKRLILLNILCILLTGSLQADDRSEPILKRIKKLEAATEGRLGVFAIETKTNRTIAS